MKKSELRIGDKVIFRGEYSKSKKLDEDGNSIYVGIIDEDNIPLLKKHWTDFHGGIIDEFDTSWDIVEVIRNNESIYKRKIK